MQRENNTRTPGSGEGLLYTQSTYREVMESDVTEDAVVHYKAKPGIPNQDILGIYVKILDKELQIYLDDDMKVWLINKLLEE